MKVRVPITLKKKHSLSVILDEPMVLQSHYYNSGLQNLILNKTKNDMSYILIDSAHSVAYDQLIKLYEYNNTTAFEEKLTIAAGLYKILGFGRLDFSKLEDENIVTVPYSNYNFSFDGSINKNRTNCYFTCGFIEAVISSAKNEPMGSYAVIEKDYSYTSGHRSIFQVTKLSLPRAIVKSPYIGSLYDPPIKRNLHNMLGEEDIVKSITRLNMSSNQKGLIYYFGIYLTRHYANYYNLVSNLFIKKLEDSKNNIGLLFYNLAERSSYYTFGSIMKSNEWNTIVTPFVDKKEDLVYATVAWINSLSWGTWNIKELVAEEGAVINIFGSYESNGYIGLFGKSAINCSCHTAVGTLAGLMNLIYLNNFPLSPETDYENMIINNKYSFIAEETRCRSKGDSICEVVVTRR